ncbi:hypothetical protein EJ06DRAFT_552602 [Trichodelitschia bisporula]|uniref:Uncharacterized protein n=1 Tax=Trichodelitschia bisporula TaxID=703511 RepID=A0A6G1IA40_9PEZI|nr:hypothetical protein EJ06DRAFT_552602 [Trichodelitschia bisporula]
MSSLAVDLYLPTSAEPSTQLSVDFYGLNDEAKVAIISYLGKPTSMTIQQMCPRESLKDHVLPLVRATIANGFIVATSERRRLNSLVDVLLRVDSAALVPLAGSSLLILYPLEQAQKEWKFLATAGTEPSQPAPLGFFIFSGIEAPATTHQPAYRPEDGTLEGYLKERLGLVGEDFFKCHEGTVAKVVYLMFNKDNELELEIFTRFFRELGARVYNHLVPGSWKGFCADKEGVVIIPNLATLLWGRTNFFEMGCCRQEKDGFGRYAFRCKPLFPSGRTVFVTDDVLENYPQKALHIVDDILKANKRKGAAKWRLGGRPGLLNWLLSLAKAHMKENENDNTTRAALWAKTCLLLPYDESRSDPPYTGPDCAVASIPPDDLPEWGELILKSKEDANTFIIEWFSVWACLNVSYCRRFFVVHSGEMSQLAEQYKHLIFQTPERYIEKKKAKT